MSDERPLPNDPAPRRTFQLRRETAFTPAEIPWAEELNEEQRLAVGAPEKHVLVLAGAGTGKTRVITYRLAYLLQQDAKVEEIFLTTFTNKAAREMMHRVETLLQRPTTGLWGGTFHSVCARLLRQEATSIGFSDRFSILDTEDANELMSTVRAERLQDHASMRFPQSAVLCSLFSLSRNMNRPPGEILAEKYPQFLELGDQILPILSGYQQRKRALNAMDYDDLLGLAVEVLQTHDDLRKKWALKFRHLLVDEYQDINHAQGTLIDLLASESANVMVVGDDAQAIYAFRGADYRNILSFPERYPDTVIYKLQINYRSTPPILELANALFATAPAHFRKTLTPVKKGGYRPALVAARDAEEEAMFIASRILDLREEGISLKDMGVLLRSHANALELELELRKRRIPFQVRGGLRFTEQAHIKDVLGHLILTVNSKDELSWSRVLKLQKKVGPKKALDIMAAISGAPDPLHTFLNGGGGGGIALDGLRHLLKALVVLPPGDGIAMIAESSYREVVFSKYTNPQQRLEDLAQLATYASKFPHTQEFLADIQLLGGLSAEEIIATEDPDERVTLSTIHQAKGLEWPVVFIPHVVEGLMPHWLALKEGGREEERRLLYVAITRAREELYISYPQIRMQRGTPILNSPSSFLTELPGGEEAFMDKAILETAKPEADATPIATSTEASLPEANLELSEMEDSGDAESQWEA